MIPYLLMSFAKILFAKWLPSSLMIVLGAPNPLKIFLYINPATVLASFMGHAIASTYLDTKSTARRMYRFPNDDGKGPIKSIPHT